MKAKELKKYLIENNLTFTEYMSELRHKKMLQNPDYDGPFCRCCGESQKNGKCHDEECIYEDKDY